MNVIEALAMLLLFHLYCNVMDNGLVSYVERERKTKTETVRGVTWTPLQA